MNNTWDGGGGGGGAGGHGLPSWSLISINDYVYGVSHIGSKMYNLV